MGQYSLETLTLLLHMLQNSTYMHNEFFQNRSRDLNRDELTLSHEPFNSGYECNFIKSVLDIQSFSNLNSLWVNGTGAGGTMVYR
jgi:hypothetical protein